MPCGALRRSGSNPSPLRKAQSSPDARVARDAAAAPGHRVDDHASAEGVLAGASRRMKASPARRIGAHRTPVARACARARTQYALEQDCVRDAMRGAEMYVKRRAIYRDAPPPASRCNSTSTRAVGSNACGSANQSPRASVALLDARQIQCTSLARRPTSASRFCAWMLRTRTSVPARHDGERFSDVRASCAHRAGYHRTPARSA